MAGLGATVTSLIQNCSAPEQVDIVFLASNVKSDQKLDLQNLLADLGLQKPPRIIEYNSLEKFGHLKSLHGDYTTYGKSLIPALFPDQKVLYLDSDLIVNTDILELRNFDNEGHPLSAVATNTVGISWDGQLLAEMMNFPADTDYFNAGVILFDCPAYIKQNFAARWDKICADYPTKFYSADQTVFNAMCKGEFQRMPRKFNFGWTPKKKLSQGETDDRIIHFLGSPKPWDIFGNKLHHGYSLWRGYTSSHWFEKYCTISSSSIKRAWQIRRSLLRHLTMK